MTHSDRDILFSNEQFVIGVLQAVSGGSIIAVVAQLEGLGQFAGTIQTLVFVTLMATALLSAVLAAYWKHQYKLWDVKAQASLDRNAQAEAADRSRKSQAYLKAMRRVLVLSVVTLASAVIVLIGSAWWRAVCMGRSA